MLMSTTTEAGTLFLSNDVNDHDGLLTDGV